MKKTFPVKSYFRKVGGKVYKVKGYSKHKRATGNKISYSKVGEFYVAHDQYGNFKGSKVVKKKTGKRSHFLALP